VLGKDFVTLLEDRGYDFFAGVPCSLLEGVLQHLELHPRLPYLAAVREDVAVGTVGGAWLAGRRPAVLIQNSGLGTCLNALASFSLMYRLPCLLLVTWRGYQGKDAPEHILMGKISSPLLDLLGIAHRALTPASPEEDLDWATIEADRRSEPVALLVPPGVFEPEPVEEADRVGSQEGGDEGFGRQRPGRARAQAEPEPLLVPAVSRAEAIRVAVGCLDDEPVIHANGYICRESFAVADRPRNFYMIGSMGLASAIGLGVALSKPGTKTVVFDGDGNLLMNLGILPMVGGLAPTNLVHLVFDNEVYGSTGNQRSFSREVRLDRMAAAAGYRASCAVTEPGALRDALKRGLAEEGPTFILAKVTAAEEEVPRIPHVPTAIRDRFRASLGAL
jgi:phosphonopyruvate decarboxylase